MIGPGINESDLSPLSGDRSGCLLSQNPRLMLDEQRQVALPHPLARLLD